MATPTIKTVVIKKRDEATLEVIFIWDQDKCIRLQREKSEPLARFSEKLSTKIARVSSTTDQASSKKKRVDMSAESLAEEPLQKLTSYQISFVDNEYQTLYRHTSSDVDVDMAFKTAAYMMVDNVPFKILMSPQYPKVLDLPQNCYVGLPIYLSVSPESMLSDLDIQWFCCPEDHLPKFKKRKPAPKKTRWQTEPQKAEDPPLEMYRTIIAQRDAFDLQTEDPATFAESRGCGLRVVVGEEDLDKVCIAKVSHKSCPGFFGLALGMSLIQPHVPRPSWCQERMALLKPRKAEATSIRVCSWNILAPVYARSPQATLVMFPYCASAHLDFAHRRSLLAREMEEIDADIMCLQECGAEVVSDLLAIYCQAHDLDYSFKTKLSKANEGLFIGWTKKRFRLVSSRSIAFKDSAVWNDTKLGDHVDSLWPGLRSHVCQKLSAVFHFVCLRDTVTDRLMIVGNQHFYWHPIGSHIRTLQCHGMLYELKSFCDAMTAQEKMPVDVTLCGDFNADDHTGVIDLIEHGHIKADHQSWKDAPLFAAHKLLSIDEDEEEGATTTPEAPVMVSNASAEGPSLVSAMDHILKRSQPFGELEFTTTIGKFHAVLDWIFISQNIKVQRTLPGLPLSRIQHDPSETIGADEGVVPGLPTAKFPSDHIPVVVEISTAA
eukprot:Blabericola_migrator_1__13563@NODE_995_length_5755_cov_170_782525_g684_i0_p1_GENE_NODE_995_length_5755_cov_170_782525_g684_i0NODE_995_length_5755_cov_170_782525_g684_i0_p1_ORF_typecomplete_len661_score93_79Exo_endo_phos/PF03372_23/9_2e19_NODE_995_length_5755_cov_170_782525_g684_i07902772